MGSSKLCAKWMYISSFFFFDFLANLSIRNWNFFDSSLKNISIITVPTHICSCWLILVPRFHIYYSLKELLKLSLMNQFQNPHKRELGKHCKWLNWFPTPYVTIIYRMSNQLLSWFIIHFCLYAFVLKLSLPM